ncbi:hypothetical protein [Acetobacterium sp.]|uniref:hypothetical protein n=1 Tax=Acetobacterium sp. TaxID=1872094 RepID=UPI0035933A18
MMKKSLLFPVTVLIMILCLGLMAIDQMIFFLPDWAVRSIGLLMLVNLPVLVYSRVRLKKTINKKKWSR